MAITAIQSVSAKTPRSVCGRIYLANGDSIVAIDSTQISIPEKRKKIKIIENAYTRGSRVGSQVKPEEVDSVIIFEKTAPERPHTFIYLPDYGWCWRLEQGQHISVYNFAPKGYFLAGNGGMWLRGNSSIIITKDGVSYNLGKPNKKMDNKTRQKLAKIIADDPELLNYIKQAHGRRDKVMRNMYKYNPK